MPDDYVVYHNTEKMGKLNTSSFGIVTGRNPQKSEGQRIWLVTGEGTPRRYYLEQEFLVDEAGPNSPQSDHEFYATGVNGTTFIPPVLLNREPWFDSLKVATGNFAFGLQAIHDNDIRAGFAQILQSYGEPAEGAWLNDPLTRVLFQNYRRTGKEAHYWASYFLRELKNRGGLETARRILAKKDDKGVTKGFVALDKAGLIELSVENVALSPEFSHLFSDAERTTARNRLLRFATSEWRPSGMFPDEVPRGAVYIEGAVSRVLVNRYERDANAREACLKIHGRRCKVCDISFLERYGEVGRDYIHVHHIKSIATIRQDYKVDPERDLIPVCPNCHAMLHTGKNPPSVEQLGTNLKASSDAS